MSQLTPPLKWHGGKQYLARRIVELMPPHTHYVETFFGGGAVMLEKNPEGVSEVANDLNGELTNFWRVLQDETTFAAFKRQADAMSFSEVEFRTAEHGGYRLHDIAGFDVDAAVAFFVRCRQSLAGRMKSFAPLSRTRTRRGMNEQASAWIAAVDGLDAVHARLRRVAILNRPALDVIRQQDGNATLFYLDPPYVPASRAAPKVYEHEMTIDAHGELLDVCRSARGRVMISGYDSELYAEQLRDWHRVEFDLPNNAAGGEQKRRMIEVVWCNFTPPATTAAAQGDA
jgi:DNA adenine methylase